MDWEDRWLSVLMFAVIVLIVLGVCAIAGDKTVKSYYLGHGASCVYAQVNWDEDPAVFCSQDATQVLDVLVKANASLKK